ncbi:MAG: hypothetical protein AAF846_24675 [Chloroflexota bacterium]
MSSHRFVRQKKFKWKQTRDSKEFEEWKVLNRFTADNIEYVELQNIKSGLKDTKQYDFLAQAFFEGLIAFEIKGEGAADLGEGETFATKYDVEAPDDIEAHYWEEAKLRLEAILPLLSIQRKKKSYQDRLDEIKAAVDDENNDEWDEERFALLNVKSARTLERLVSKFIKSNGNIRSLLRNYKNSGAPGQPGINSDAQVLEALDIVSLDASPKEVLGETELLVDEANAANESDEILIAPSLSTVDRMIKRQRYEKKLERFLGPIRSIINSKQHGVFRELSYPRERVELDGTKTDLIVVNDDGEPIGRLTFIVAIDVKTRVVLGYYLGFEPESWQSVSDTLYDVIRYNESPITRWGTTNQLEKNYGLVYSAAHDRGKGFKNTHMIDSMYALGTTIFTVGTLHGEGKAFVESFLKTVNKSFWHVQIGTTLSNYLDLGKHDPRKVACVYLSELDRKFNKYRFDYYHMDGHSGLNGASPHDKYHEFINTGWEPPLPPNLDNLSVLLGRTAYKELSDKGILELYIRYNNKSSDELVSFVKSIEYFRAHPGAAPVRKTLLGKVLPPHKVKVKIIPTDIHTVYVHNYLNNTYIPLYSHHPEYTRGLPAWKHRIILNMLNKSNDKITDKTLARVKRELREEFSSQAPSVQKARFETDGKASRDLNKPKVASDSSDSTPLSVNETKDALSEDELSDIFANSRDNATQWFEDEDDD